MQARVAFNAGEFAPEMALRSDIDYYSRACQTLENWQVSQMGGVSRRKGMRYFADATSSQSILLPYIYSYAENDNMRFIVEVDHEQVRVLDMNGAEVARFESNEDLSFAFELSTVRYKQVNALLIITSQDNPPLVLKYDGEEQWTLEEFEIKHRPWRHDHEQREQTLQVRKDGAGIDVIFPEDVKDDERPNYAGTVDYLRLSYWVEQQEAESKASDIQDGIEVVTEVPAMATKGKKFAINTDNVVKYWVCSQDWSVSNNYVAGMDSPVNYPSNFVAAENVDGFESVTPVYSVKDAGTSIKKGTKVAIKAGYWEYYTCIKDFSDKQEGFTKFTDYPGYFIQGVAVGNALPCKGEWVFYCSGTWVGCYVVRRNYETKLLNGDWEDRGLSFSRNDGMSNTQVSGTETDEACYMRLFLTKSKRMSDTDIKPGFPPDSTSNRLIVKGYKHDMVLKATPTDDGEDVYWSCPDKVQTEWGAVRDVSDWSWTSWSGRYGYPLLCDVFVSRLVFASTEGQPQTIWMSKVDDINNFMTGKNDDDAISLTMFTTTQNPICWMKPQGDRVMLGTSEAEHIISSGSAAFTSSSATVRDHGYVGSQDIAAVGANDKMLYVERGGGRVFTFEYSLEIDGWRSSDITVFAPHIAREHGGFVRSSLIRKPDTVVLYVMGDGQLALCTYNSLQEVKAWHRWVTDGSIKEVLGMPNGNKNDRIFLVVERNGVANIEVLDDESDYLDNGHDYVSLLTTNALNNVLEAYVQKHHNPIVKAFIGEPFMLNGDNLQVSTDGENWYSSEMIDGEISRGWKNFCTLRDWDREQFTSFRVTGNQAFNLLGLQA